MTNEDVTLNKEHICCGEPMRLFPKDEKFYYAPTVVWCKRCKKWFDSYKKIKLDKEE